MRHDSGIPALLVHHLNPCHIVLGQRGAAPLPRLQHDNLYRLALRAQLLEHAAKYSLRIVQHELHIAAALLRLDGDKRRGIEWEIVFGTQLYQFGKHHLVLPLHTVLLAKQPYRAALVQLPHKFVASKFTRNPPLVLHTRLHTEKKRHPVTNRVVACDRVKCGLQRLVALVVLCKYGVDIFTQILLCPQSPLFLFKSLWRVHLLPVLVVVPVVKRCTHGVLSLKSCNRRNPTRAARYGRTKTMAAPPCISQSRWPHGHNSPLSDMPKEEAR